MPVRHDDPRPPFAQIAGELREAITNGAYQPGDRLPSTRALAKEWAVAPMTVQHALAELRKEGLIVSQQGRGAFVQDPATVQADTGSDLAEAQRMLREAQKRLDRLEAQQDTPSTPPPERGQGMGI